MQVFGRPERQILEERLAAWLSMDAVAGRFRRNHGMVRIWKMNFGRPPQAACEIECKPRNRPRIHGGLGYPGTPGHSTPIENKIIGLSRSQLGACRGKLQGSLWHVHVLACMCDLFAFGPSVAICAVNRAS